MAQSQTVESTALVEFQLCQTSQIPIVCQHFAAKKHLRPASGIDASPSRIPLSSQVFLQGMLAANDKYTNSIQSVLQTTT